MTGMANAPLGASSPVTPYLTELWYSVFCIVLCSVLCPSTKSIITHIEYSMVGNLTLYCLLVKHLQSVVRVHSTENGHSMSLHRLPPPF